MKPLYKILSLLLSLAIYTGSFSQGLSREEVKTLIDSKTFIFKAQSAMPARGGIMQLTSDYDVKLVSDSLTSHLPYYGRAYSMPINPGNGGIQFQSTRFDYSAKEKRKGWNIDVRPRDALDVRQMVFNVFENGRASLQVTSNNRQSISFNGYITPIENKQ